MLNSKHFLTNSTKRNLQLTAKKIVAALLMASVITSCSQQPHKGNRSQVRGVVVPAHIKILLDKTSQLDKAKSYQTAIAEIEKDPSNPEHLYNLGYDLMQITLKNHTDAEHDLALSYMNEALNIVPGNQSVLNALYAIYYEDALRSKPGAFEQALAVFQALAESSQAQLNPPSLTRYVVETLAQEKSKQRDRQKIREILLTAIKEQPRNDISYYQLARLYAEDHYYPLAIATLKLGLERNPKSIGLLKYTASYYEERAEATGCNYEHTIYIQHASNYYKKAIALDPENPKYHFDLARTSMDLSQIQLSLYEMQLANSLKINPAGLMTAAQFSSVAGKHVDATKLLQEALQQGYEIKDSGFHEIYMNQGDWQTAAKGYAAYIKSLNKFSVYDLIKSDIIANQAKVSPLVVNQKISLSNDWEENLYKFWNFKISDAELKQSAKNVCQKTEYLFYTGYRDLMSNKKDIALVKFKEAAKQPAPRFIERPLANILLKENQVK